MFGHKEGEILKENIEINTLGLGWGWKVGFAQNLTESEFHPVFSFS